MNDLYSDYIFDKRKSIDKAKHLQRMGEELYKFNDAQLRILNNTGYHANPEMEVFELQELHPELRDDPAFKALYRLYGELLGAQKGYGLDADLQIHAVRRYATDLANRRMKERDYNGFAQGIGEVFWESEEILTQKAELIRTQES